MGNTKKKKKSESRLTRVVICCEHKGRISTSTALPNILPSLKMEETRACCHLPTRAWIEGEGAGGSQCRWCPPSYCQPFLRCSSFSSKREGERFAFVFVVLGQRSCFIFCSPTDGVALGRRKFIFLFLSFLTFFNGRFDLVFVFSLIRSIPFVDNSMPSCLLSLIILV